MNKTLKEEMDEAKAIYDTAYDAYTADYNAAAYDDEAEKINTVQTAREDYFKKRDSYLQSLKGD